MCERSLHFIIVSLTPTAHHFISLGLQGTVDTERGLCLTETLIFLFKSKILSKNPIIAAYILAYFFELFEKMLLGIFPLKRFVILNPYLT